MTEIPPSPDQRPKKNASLVFRLRNESLLERKAKKTISKDMEQQQQQNAAVAFEKANQDTAPDSRRDAALLLDVAALATREYRMEGPHAFWGDDDDDEERSVRLQQEQVLCRSPFVQDDCSNHHHQVRDPPHALTTEQKFLWNRIRAVSMDCHEQEAPSPPPPPPSARVSPESSPVLSSSSIRRRRRRGRPAGKRLGNNNKKSQSSAGDVHHHVLKLHLTPKRARQAHHHQQQQQPVKMILRKKFSWKNYPELEAFLIANRDEYLRHSALNYTVQQKEYNNRLTERLLALATRHGYEFDEDDFSFVTVRDRIRCYFKSYVQSAKKRGIFIGYAARKAGLVNEKDLHAGVKGRIVEPSNTTM